MCIVCVCDETVLIFWGKIRLNVSIFFFLLKPQKFIIKVNCTIVRDPAGVP